MFSGERAKMNRSYCSCKDCADRSRIDKKRNKRTLKGRNRPSKAAIWDNLPINQLSTNFNSSNQEE